MSTSLLCHASYIGVDGVKYETTRYVRRVISLIVGMTDGFAKPDLRSLACGVQQPRRRLNNEFLRLCSKNHLRAVEK